MSYHKARKNRLQLYTDFLKSVEAPEDLERIPGYDPESLEKAATHFKLDHTNPSHLNLIVHLLADLQFGERKPGRQKGHKTTWTEHTSDLLFLAYFDLKTRHPKYKHTEISDLICKNEEFRNFDTDTLRRRLSGLRQAYEMVADDIPVWNSVWD
jgi:hypothetical protein